MPRVSLPQDFKIVDASAGPVTTNGGVTFDYVSLKNVIRAWIVIQLTQAAGHATVIQPRRATAVDGTGAADIAHAARIWANEDTGASDTLVAQTAAVKHTVANDIKKKMVVIEIDPVEIGAYDVLGCTISDSSQATNFVSAQYVLQTSYRQATPPAAITD
jgi:hypothetical protein